MVCHWRLFVGWAQVGPWLGAGAGLKCGVPGGSTCDHSIGVIGYGTGGGVGD